MTKKTPDPARRSLFEGLLRGLSEFTEAFYEGLYPSEEEAQQRAQMTQRLDEMEAAVQGIQEKLAQAGQDHQTTLDTIDRLIATMEHLAQLQDQVLEHIESVERAGRPQEVARWKEIAKRGRDLLWLVLGVWTAEAIWQKVVQDEWERRKSQVIEWLSDLLKETEPALGPLGRPLPTASETLQLSRTNSAKKVSAVILIQTLNVRSGPGMNYSVIGHVFKGERYDITGKNEVGDWFRINFNGQIGWVAAHCTEIQPSPEIRIIFGLPPPPR